MKVLYGQNSGVKWRLMAAAFAAHWGGTAAAPLRADSAAAKTLCVSWFWFGIGAAETFFYHF